MVNKSELAIIVPMYNAANWIERAVDSVINQSYKNWRMYIIDDCSCDDSVKILNQKYKDERIVIISNQKNLGVARTRNRGIEIAEENIICFLDSDDEWLEDKLSLQMDAVNQGFNLVLSEYYYLNKKCHHIRSENEKIKRNDFLKKRFRVCFSSVCVNFSGKNKEYFKNIGHEDYEYLNRCFNNIGNGQAFIINKPTVKYYCQENSLSSNKIKAARWHYSILEKELGFGFFKRITYFFHYLFNAVIFSKKHQ